MSVQSNQALSAWKIVWAKLRRCRLELLPGQEATQEQAAIIQDCYLLWLCIWSDLLDPLPAHAIDEIIRLLRNEPVTTVMMRLGDLDVALIRCIQYEVDFPTALRAQFKQVLGDYPHSGKWTWIFTTTIERCVSACDDDVAVFRAIHQILCFPGRVTVPDREDLMNDAAAAFLQQEEELKYQYPGIGLPLNRILKRWFPNSVETYMAIYGDWLPKHGNGSVAEGPLSVGEKYHELRRDKLLDGLDALTGGLGYPRYIPTGLNRTAKVQFVPKNTLKLRTICMEPAALQFQQQAGFRALNKYFRAHRYLRYRIDLAHPEYNRELARIGSFDGSFATIDLSAASDSVSWRLVRSAFDGTPLLDLFVATRSTHEVMPDGQVLRTKKFAPMGSALCFPVECLVFAAIVEYAIDHAGGHPKHSLYRVYGDDIIVEREFAQPVIGALQDFGFTVNVGKSYYADSHLTYRESCGGEYVLGADVAPVRCPRGFRGLSSDRCLADARQYEGLVDLANELLPVSPTARRLVIMVLNQLPKWARPLFVAIGEDGGIQSPTPTNYRLYCREWVDPQVTPNNRYQRTRYRHGAMPTPQGRIVEEDEDIRLYECLRSMMEAPDADLINRDGDTFIDFRDQLHRNPRLGSRWS